MLSSKKRAKLMELKDLEKRVIAAEAAAMIAPGSPPRPKRYTTDAELSTKLKVSRGGTETPGDREWIDAQELDLRLQEHITPKDKANTLCFMQLLANSKQISFLGKRDFYDNIVVYLTKEDTVRLKLALRRNL